MEFLIEKEQIFDSKIKIYKENFEKNNYCMIKEIENNFINDTLKLNQELVKLKEKIANLQFEKENNSHNENFQNINLEGNYQLSKSRTGQKQFPLKKKKT